MTVAEVTFCNSISVAEHVVMMILSLVRNYLPSNRWVLDGGWNIADCVARSYDLEGMDVGTVAAGRIGLAVLRRLAPFDVRLHYTDRHRLPAELEQQLNLTYHASAAEMVPHCDVVTTTRGERCRTTAHHGMTPHISGSSLSAQARYAAGTREILESYFGGTPIRDEYLIVDGGKLAGTGAHSYSTRT